jgi:hypothetical protein
MMITWQLKYVSELIRIVSIILLTIFPWSASSAQTLEPPINQYLAVSPYPMAHRNPYSQGSETVRGPEPGDVFDIDAVEPSGLSVGRSAPLPLLSERYPTGERVVWGSTGNKVYKALLTPTGIEIVAEYQIDRTALFVDQSMYNILLKGNRLVVPDGGYLRMFADADSSNPRSAIVLKRSLRLPSSIGSAGAISVTYDGRIVFGSVVSKRSGDLFSIGIVKQDFTDLKYHQLSQISGEKARNNIALDEDGGIYVVTSKRVVRVQWNGSKLSTAWSTIYNMGADGSGTTPSLMGRAGEDKLVLFTDGNSPNNIVAMWRDTIPSNWSGLPGYNRRVAAVKPAPYSTPANGGKTNENSPVVWGYGVAFAQWNGIREPSCTPAKGVQKFVWNPSTRTLNLAWSTDAVNMNNVLMLSSSSNIIYGIGRHSDCIYYLEMLDWNTGALLRSVPLGSGSEFHNPGNSMPINDDRRILSTSLKGIVSIRPITQGF